jgi:hypothetical protein
MNQDTSNSGIFGALFSGWGISITVCCCLLIIVSCFFVLRGNSSSPQPYTPMLSPMPSYNPNYSQTSFPPPGYMPMPSAPPMVPMASMTPTIYKSM